MEEERGVSIGEIFKVIFKRLWWVIGVTAAFMLVFVLLIQFWYNKNNRNYVVNYNISFPNSGTGYYPDGTAFRLSDLVTPKTLNEIKASDERFASIDVEEMYVNDDITIEVVDPSTTTKQEPSYISLQMSVKYFTDTKQAAAFIRAVAEYPINHAMDLINQADHLVNLKAFDNSKTYGEQLAYLQAQLGYVDAKYSSLISLYGQYYSVNGVTLAEYKMLLNKVFDSTDYANLVNELNTRYYVKDKDRFRQNYETEIEALNKEKRHNLTKIENLEEARDKVYQSGSTATDVETFNAQIVSLVNRNSQIDIELEEIQEKLDRLDAIDTQAQTDFENKLQAVYDDLKEQTEIYEDIRVAVYEEKSVITYKSNKIKVSGGLNIIIAAALGAIIGFVGVGAVICIIDMPKYLKARDAKSACVPAEGNPEDGENK